jgi:hypothetical protein
MNSIRITDSTPYPVSGHVHYPTFFCSDDDYDVAPAGTWSNGIGLCLIERITATVHTPDGDVTAQPYVSSGTPLEDFAVVSGGVPGTYLVTRLVDGTEDVPPSNYREPTEQQK